MKYDAPRAENKKSDDPSASEKYHQNKKLFFSIAEFLSLVKSPILYRSSNNHAGFSRVSGSIKPSYGSDAHRVKHQ